MASWDLASAFLGLFLGICIGITGLVCYVLYKTKSTLRFLWNSFKWLTKEAENDG